MTDTGIYATTAQVQRKAGAKASSVSKAEAYVNDYVFQAEGEINILCRKVFAATSTAFAALPSTTRGVLSNATASKAAIDVIEYAMTMDASGATFPTRGEAEDMIVTLRDDFLRCLSILRDKKMQDFLMTGVEN
jgi:glyoxylate utilization-related uncharacterized protein